jgi:uroporphyrinogen decarboxylase
MSMSAYEVICRAIEFRRPDRLPLRLTGPLSSPAFGLIQSDVHQVPWNFIGTGDRRQRQTYDEWGCLWVRSDQDNMGQIKEHPLEDWKALDHFRWLNPDEAHLYTGMEARFVGSDSKYVMTGIFMLLFERLQALRGFENALTDLYLERECIEDLADRILEIQLGIIQNIAGRFPGQIHGMWFTEDWGTQQALMIAPALWREFFKPRYRRIIQAIHAAGWHAWMHCDGQIEGILEDLVEIGVDVLNLPQPRVLDVEAVGRRLRGRLCFETACDIQHSLPSGNAAAIRKEAGWLLEHWAAPYGGFILSIDEDDAQSLGFTSMLPVMLDAFLQADPYAPPRRQQG